MPHISLLEVIFKDVLENRDFFLVASLLEENLLDRAVYDLYDLGDNPY